MPLLYRIPLNMVKNRLIYLLYDIVKKLHFLRIQTFVDVLVDELSGTVYNWIIVYYVPRRIMMVITR